MELTRASEFSLQPTHQFALRSSLFDPRNIVATLGIWFFTIMMGAASWITLPAYAMLAFGSYVSIRSGSSVGRYIDHLADGIPGKQGVQIKETLRSLADIRAVADQLPNFSRPDLERQLDELGWTMVVTASRASAVESYLEAHSVASLEAHLAVLAQTDQSSELYRALYDQLIASRSLEERQLGVRQQIELMCASVATLRANSLLVTEHGGQVNVDIAGQLHALRDRSNALVASTKEIAAIGVAHG